MFGSNRSYTENLSSGSQGPCWWKCFCWVLCERGGLAEGKRGAAQMPSLGLASRETIQSAHSTNLAKPSPIVDHHNSWGAWGHLQFSQIANGLSSTKQSPHKLRTPETNARTRESEIFITNLLGGVPLAGRQLAIRRNPSRVGGGNLQGPDTSL